jgi:hypothetical protein
MTTTTIQALIVQHNSPLLNQECALCHEPFDVGDRVVICPIDATRHHTQCWEVNGNQCVALGCEGAGPVLSERLSQAWDELEENGDNEETAIVIVPSEMDEDDSSQAASYSGGGAQWQTGEMPGGGRYAVYQSNNRGCSRGCWLSFLLFNLFLCAILILGTYTFFEAISRFLQQLLAG